MGRKYHGGVSLAHALFSRVQLRVLSILFGHPGQEFSASEVIRRASSGSGAVQRELERLSVAGIVMAGRSGNRKLYRANAQSPIFNELHQIVLKTEGLVEPIRHALRAFQDRIAVAFVYGSIAKQTDTATSDIDLMIIGTDLSYGALYSALQKVEKSLGRSINPNVMAPGEWKKRLEEKRSFADRIAQQPKLFVFGDEDELQRVG